jgi:chitinase
MFYCGFSGDYCGQSRTDDVNPGSTIVILSFVNTQPDGSVRMDEANFPQGPFNTWKASGKQVLISVGGQFGNFYSVYVSDNSVANFVNSLVGYVRKYNLDGVDLDIEQYNANPRAVANMILKLRAELDKLGGKKLLVVSPECVTVYQGKGIPDADTGSGYWNYFVPIIQLADSAIDYYQVQAYNNWYAFPGDSADYLKNVYLNWRNLPDLTLRSPLSGFKGVAPEKLVMGLIASTSAGGSAYYREPSVLK